MGRTLIVGDVHGCADPLRRLLKLVRPKRVVLLGDLFTRGPDPGGVWRLIQRWDADSVLGNHDDEVLRAWRPGRHMPKRAFAWLRRRPIILGGGRWVAVHAGIHPFKGPHHTKRHQALHLRDFRGRPWWQMYRGEALIVHGHDAARGLNDRRPFTLGLDTGCFRTGQLSGYIAQEDRIVTVD